MMDSSHRYAVSYTTLEDSKLIAGVMGRLGIEADAYWLNFDFASKQVLLMPIGDIQKPNIGKPFWDRAVEKAPSYRLDKILAALPDWVFSCEVNDFTLAFTFPKGIEQEFRREIADMVEEVLLKRGKEALSAGCQLLALLEEEGLI